MDVDNNDEGISIDEKGRKNGGRGRYFQLKSFPDKDGGRRKRVGMQRNE